MKYKDTIITIVVNISRIIVGAVFAMSGFVKAIDPLGTQYKIHDYLDAAGLGTMVPDGMMLVASVLLSMVEFSMGVFLLLAIGRRLVSRLAAAFMAVMTLVTVWVYVANPVQDCGCFGDAVVLGNGETLLKNIVLMAMITVLAVMPCRMVRMLSRSNQWMVFHYTILFSIVMSVWCLYDLPVYDFRPYHVGANIVEGMEIPEDAEQPEFETTFIMKKDGKQQEFTLENYPDSTWEFVDSKTVTVKEGYVPPIHDFSITTADGDDITDQVLSDPGYTFLLVAPFLDKADDSNFGPIDQLYEYAQDNGCQFYCLTSSGDKEIQRWKNITGAEYPFCQTDAITLKTIIRSNPGLVLIKNGVVQAKWSHNNLPHDEMLNDAPDKATWMQMDESSAITKITKILLWFFIPLLILVISDRLWTWSRWLKRIEKEKL